MKIKFGDMTVRQLVEMCSDCIICPFKSFPIACSISYRVNFHSRLNLKLLSQKIDLPDEEVKEDAEI